MQIFLQSNTTHAFDVNGCETVQDAKNFLSQTENIDNAEVSNGFAILCSIKDKKYLNDDKIEHIYMRLKRYYKTWKIIFLLKYNRSNIIFQVL